MQEYLPGWVRGIKSQFSKKDFGDEFLWGVSSCAFQTEGGVYVDGKGESIWDRFTKKRGAIHRGENALVACDFYRRYRDDISLIKDLNFKVFRTSFAWSRIFPDGVGSYNTEGLDFYDRVVDYCLELGIEPWITLYHWDLPQALQDKGGWTNRDVVEWFSEYADFVTNHFGDRVKNWMILNEPLVFTALGYLIGIHAPGKRGLDNFLSAVHHAALCQSAGGRITRSNVKDSTIGTTFSCAPVFPYKEKERHVKAAERADAILNRLFIEPSLGLGYPVNSFKLLGKIEKFIHQDDMKLLPFDFDFIGLQNYTREVVSFSLIQPYGWMKQVRAYDRNVPVTEMGWEIYPPSIYLILKQFAAYGPKKIIITENGAAFHDVPENGVINDKKRISYISQSLEQVLKAKKEGVNVQGYFCWTLTDNFEWAEGYKPRFGLVYVDHKTQQRIVKESGKWFRRFLNEC